MGSDQAEQIKTGLCLLDRINRSRWKTGVSIGSDQPEPMEDRCVYWIGSGGANGNWAVPAGSDQAEKKTEGCAYWIGSNGAGEDRAVSIGLDQPEGCVHEVEPSGGCTLSIEGKRTPKAPSVPFRYYLCLSGMRGESSAVFLTKKSKKIFAFRYAK